MTHDPDDVAEALDRIGIRSSTPPRLVASGWESHIYRCETATGAVAARVYARTDMSIARREADTMRAVAAAGYPVPAIRGLTRVGRHPTVVMDFVEGTDLWGGPHTLPEAATICRRLMEDLHALPVGSTPADPLEWMRDHTGRAVDAMPRFGPYAAALWLAPPAEVESAHCHLDFHPGNVLWDGRPWVVDWTSARVTDPRFDVLWTRLLAEMYQPGLAPVFTTDRPEPWFAAAMAFRRLSTVAAMLSTGEHAAGDLLTDHLPHMQIPARWLGQGTGVSVPDVGVVLAG
jgi:aminoglycoside phosphotransferase (APT) family kinase protein